jgi:hypothetical protein
MWSSALTGAGDMGTLERNGGHSAHLCWSAAMNPDLQSIKFSNSELPEQESSQGDSPKGWRLLSALLSSQTMLVVLATLSTVVLMLAFHQIVLGAVEQGKLLQQARNLQSEAVFRCKSLRSATARDQCLREPHPVALTESRL